MREEQEYSKLILGKRTTRVSIPREMLRQMGIDTRRTVVVKRYITKGKQKQIILRFKYLEDIK